MYKENDYVINYLDTIYPNDMKARIYKPAKSAMQSAKGKTKEWCLEYIGADERFVDSIMGWTGSSNMKKTEVKLYFTNLEDAQRYASDNNIKFEVILPKASKPVLKAYSDNFKYNCEEQ